MSFAAECLILPGRDRVTQILNLHTYPVKTKHGADRLTSEHHESYNKFGQVVGYLWVTQ